MCDLLAKRWHLASHTSCHSGHLISSTSDVDNTIALLECVYVVTDSEGHFGPKMKSTLRAHSLKGFFFFSNAGAISRAGRSTAPVRTAPLVLPDSLGRGAQSRLGDARAPLLKHISVPGLPELLLSSFHLVHFHLCGTPYFECILPPRRLPLAHPS